VNVDVLADEVTEEEVPGLEPRAGRRARETPIRVLVTEDAPSAGVLAAVRGLRTAGYEPWVAAADGRSSYAARSRAAAGRVVVPDPARGRAAYLEALLAAARRLSVRVLLPGTEQAMLALCRAGECFGDVVLGAGDADAVEAVTDKARLAALAAEVGLRSPVGWLLARAEILARDDFPFPLVVKTPRKVSRHRGHLVTLPVRRVDDALALHRLVESVPAEQLLLQPYLEGRLAAVTGVAWAGRVVCLGHQMAERIFPLHAGVSAYARTIAPDEELEQRVRDLLARTGWSGIFELQFLRTPEQAYLIDFNTHLYGSLALSIAAGLNLPAIWLELLLGSQPTGCEYRLGTRYRNEERDAGALAGLLLARRYRSFAAALIPKPGTAHAFFSARDPRPAVLSLRHLRHFPAALAETMADAGVGRSR
jgi:carbamoyl-phosphate synthase large subunit